MTEKRKEHYTIKEIPSGQRPRERLLQKGAAALSDAEVLAIILATGYEDKTAIDLANSILIQFGGFPNLVNTTIEELSTIKGVGLAKSCQIKAALEIGKRIATFLPGDRITIRCPKDVERLLMEEMRFLEKEVFRVISLNTKNEVIGNDVVSIGSLNASIVHPRELFKECIRKNAASIILAHNHPSGNPEPSREDLMVTKRLIQGGKLLGIDVLDHIIFGQRVFISMKEKGLLEEFS
jgi:DNA repair protein RadC